MSIFKAYDVRGIVPGELNTDVAYKIGRLVPSVLAAERVVVGRDMRLSSPEVAAALIRGVSDSGAEAADMGLSTTPMNYFAVGSLSYGAGAMVTASHNPPEWNGFKFSRSGAAPVSYDTGLGEIEKRYLAGKLPPKRSPGAVKQIDVWPDYKAHLLGFAEGMKPLRVVVDTGNGMSGAFIPDLFESLPCEFHGLYLELDGSFPNHEPNPLKAKNLRDLQAAVKRERADVGVAFDGDGDRCVFVDERAEIISGDLVTALLAREMIAREPGAAVVYDLRSSRVVPEEIKAAGGVPVECRVGHSFIKAVMREHRAPFGGELSGHFYFRDQFYADSGELAMVSVLRLLSGSGKKMSELIGPLRRYHATGEINFEVEDKDAKIAELARAFADGEQSRLDGLAVRYKDWWFNVRKSNTEPVLRLNLEAETPRRRDEGRRRVEALIKGGK